jgi:hypothetical protein
MAATYKPAPNLPYASIKIMADYTSYTRNSKWGTIRAFEYSGEDTETITPEEIALEILSCFFNGFTTSEKESFAHETVGKEDYQPYALDNISEIEESKRAEYLLVQLHAATKFQNNVPLVNDCLYIMQTYSDSEKRQQKLKEARDWHNGWSKFMTGAVSVVSYGCTAATIHAMTVAIDGIQFVVPLSVMHVFLKGITQTSNIKSCAFHMLSTLAMLAPVWSLYHSSQELRALVDARDAKLFNETAIKPDDSKSYLQNQEIDGKFWYQVIQSNVRQKRKTLEEYYINNNFTEHSTRLENSFADLPNLFDGSMEDNEKREKMANSILNLNLGLYDAINLTIRDSSMISTWNALDIKLKEEETQMLAPLNQWFNSVIKTNIPEFDGGTQTLIVVAGALLMVYKLPLREALITKINFLKTGIVIACIAAGLAEFPKGIVPTKTSVQLTNTHALIVSVMIIMDMILQVLHRIFDKTWIPTTIAAAAQAFLCYFTIDVTFTTAESEHPTAAQMSHAVLAAPLLWRHNKFKRV